MSDEQNRSIPEPLIIGGLVATGIVGVSVAALLPPEFTIETIIQRLIFGGLGVVSFLAAGADILLQHQHTTLVHEINSDGSVEYHQVTGKIDVEDAGDSR